MQGATLLSAEAMETLMSTKYESATEKNTLSKLLAEMKADVINSSFIENIERTFCCMVKPTVSFLRDVVTGDEQQIFPHDFYREGVRELCSVMRIMELVFLGVIHTHVMDIPLRLSDSLRDHTIQRMTEDQDDLSCDIMSTAVQTVTESGKEPFVKFFMLHQGRFHVDYTDIANNKLIVTVGLVLAPKVDEKNIREYIAAEYYSPDEPPFNVKQFISEVSA